MLDKLLDEMLDHLTTHLGLPTSVELNIGYGC